VEAVELVFRTVVANFNFVGNFVESALGLDQFRGLGLGHGELDSRSAALVTGGYNNGRSYGELFLSKHILESRDDSCNLVLSGDHLHGCRVAVGGSNLELHVGTRKCVALDSDLVTCPFVGLAVKDVPVFYRDRRVLILLSCLQLTNNTSLGTANLGSNQPVALRGVVVQVVLAVFVNSFTTAKVAVDEVEFAHAFTLFVCIVEASHRHAIAESGNIMLDLGNADPARVPSQSRGEVFGEESVLLEECRGLHVSELKSSKNTRGTVLNVSRHTLVGVAFLLLNEGCGTTCTFV